MTGDNKKTFSFIQTLSSRLSKMLEVVNALPL